MAKIPARVEPVFEGDRKIARMSELTQRVDAEFDDEPVASTSQASDYARPEIRALSNLEAEIGKLATAPQNIQAIKRSHDVGNSADMKRVQEFLNSTITAAHEDTCKALDRKVSDARSLVERLETSVAEHKRMLQDKGQEIAVLVESTIQGLTRTCEMVEKQTADLRNPKLEAPTTGAPSEPDAQK